ncbi:MAG: ABC transporter permease, partial [Candidatus Hodarchaeota archaeon]
MKEYIKIGLRNLKKRKVRTTFTIMAIALGVAILVGVNLGSDMINSSIKGTLDENLGDIDIMAGNTWGPTVSYVDVTNFFLLYDNPDFDSWVPRYGRPYWYIAAEKISNSTFYTNLYCYLVGIDETLETEARFGNARILDVHPLFDESSIGKKVPIENFLTSAIDRPIVLSKAFLEAEDLEGKITAGDIIYIKNEAYNANFSVGHTSGNPVDWPNFTVTAIIDDLGEMGTNSLYWYYFNYMRLEDMWNYVFNFAVNDDINCVFVHSSNEAHVESLQYDLQERLMNDLGWNPSISTPKLTFMEGVEPVNNYARIFFTVLAAISLVICGVLIKNLFETAKETDIHEIGILKGVGFNQHFIEKIYITQILTMSTFGVALGFAGGIGFGFVFINFLSSSDLSDLLLGGNFQIEIYFSLSWITVGAGIAAGYLIPLIFGIVPVVQSARTSVINAIQTRPRVRTFSPKVKIGLNIIILIIGIVMTVLGIYLVNLGISELLEKYFEAFDKLILPIIYLFSGVIGFLMGLILISVFALPALSKGLTSLFLLPSPRTLKNICHRNLMRNKRRTINTFVMMAIGLSFLVTITTISNSISEGAYPGKKTQLGGDIQLGQPFCIYSPYCESMTYDAQYLEELESLPYVTGSCLYRFAPDLSEFYFMSGNLNFLGNKIDDFGFYHEPSNYIDPFITSMTFGIVNGKDYYDINKDAIISFTEPGNADLPDLFDELDDTRSIILQSDLKDHLGKEVGDMTHITMEGMSTDLRIIGFADVLPGFPWTLDLSSVYGGYSSDNKLDYCGMISWNTYNWIVEEFWKDIDLIVMG